MTYKQAKTKFFLEKLATLPFVWLGQFFGGLLPLKENTGIFLFFSSADIGGAPRVNIDIARCIKNRKPIIIFSKKPKNNLFIEEFRGLNAIIIDLSPYIDNKLFHFVNFFFRGVIAAWINKNKSPVVFGGECLFFYKILQHVKKETKRVELCHLPTWIGYTIGHIDRIDMRIFSVLSLKKEVEAQYQENHLPGRYYDRLYFIDNAIDIPPYSERYNQRIEVVFIGRGAPQKRVHLAAAIAEKLHRQNANVHFTFVGDVEEVVFPDKYPYCTFRGNIKDQQEMEAIYATSDVLLLTSAYEGLPVVVMKMMAYGKVVISTAVNGIPDYILHENNGLLIHRTDEAGIVEEGVQLIQQLIGNKKKLTLLGKRSYEIAKEKFSRTTFCRFYSNALLV
ncbi:glycosyltransferase family 4 protein [Agriterribacter sp.]|uniref:glycosyltransferase family 4 protein n=1 Tax=Agriterribacter sp. TaxID=2821509 RepID=UPI002C8A0248|nr:glycosyltransferase family 4 protein [Agriterribacter sp.]HRO45092.1 glycosyltransferase family 4 protein [Agriterribacter sp.]HRQ15467.1 glycosyltransferase family 4 protein [Agriterribacter sp.]